MAKIEPIMAGFLMVLFQIWRFDLVFVDELTSATGSGGSFAPPKLRSCDAVIGPRDQHRTLAAFSSP